MTDFKNSLVFYKVAALFGVYSSSHNFSQILLYINNVNNYYEKRY